jgi:hypothetical protein
MRRKVLRRRKTIGMTVTDLVWITMSTCTCPQLLWYLCMFYKLHMSTAAISILFSLSFIVNALFVSGIWNVHHIIMSVVYSAVVLSFEVSACMRCMLIILCMTIGCCMYSGL